MKIQIEGQNTDQHYTLIADLFSEQAIKTPGVTAVSFGGRELTYKELDTQSTLLSKAILASASSSSFVGISTTRCVEMVVGIVAILKAGKAYLPLDPTYPKERISQIVSDSGIDTCLAVGKEKTFFEEFKVDILNIESNTGHQPNNLVPEKITPIACLLYTSGSTGKPKGVCLTQEGLKNFLLCQLQLTHSAEGIKTLQFCHLSFDASFQEVFIPLVSGGTLVLIDDDIRLDAHRLLSFIEQQSINRIFLPYVALQYLTETAEITQKFPACLQEVITGGELLKITPQIAHFFSALSTCSLVNVYGPTETCIWATELRLKGNADKWPALPTIGQPVNNAGVYIVDENLKPVPPGEQGEIFITGVGVADGYLNREELTAEKFLSWHHPEKGILKTYRTGDLARYLPDGHIEFLGRRDDQVKIRGNRVELGEIEVVLAQQPNIQQVVVAAREDVPGQKRLVAYMIAPDGNKDIAVLRQALEKQLPDYMIPAAFVWLDTLPKTVSGKVDKKALPKPDIKRPDLEVAYRKPVTSTEKKIAEIWISLLLLDRVGIDDNFFELGGSSLLAQKTVALLQHQFNYPLPITKLYQYATIHGIAAFLDGQKERIKTSAKKKLNKTNSDTDIAIVGMAGRFPGANTIAELWNVLKEGRETTHFFTDEELDPSIPLSVKNDPLYVKARGVIDKAKEFDPVFFGITPKLAELMDPQQRIFLEVAWEALESTGYLAQNYKGTIGVFAGCGNNTYFNNNVVFHRDMIEQAGVFHVTSVNDKDYVSTRTAYSLNLKGPAVTVQSACSTSLLAIAQAVESLRKGQCEMALAGGVAINAPINSGHIYDDGAMLSKDGHCRSFDADAQGTVFSDGAGVVLLKTKEQAIADGDIIYAIIKGVGISNDGGGKGSFTAPSAEGQAAAISMAIEDAAIDPADISYIETHGTATPLGDPIEIDGLNLAFGQQEKKQYCAIGTIKSNMGHLTIAAGVTGVIKTALSLYYKKIPASLHYKKPNPNIDFANSPFFVNATLKDWNADGKRIAGVSSFGVGGTNVHAILEGYENAEVETSPGRPVYLINWSAKTETSAGNYAKELATYLRNNVSVDPADIAYTLTQRRDFNSRKFLVASSREEAIEKLDASSLLLSKKIKEKATEIIFMFPGQGAQYANMGRDLYNAEPVFHDAMNECARILQNELKENILDIIYPAESGQAAEDRLKNTYYSQPAIFSVEYALAKLWMSWGVHPSGFIGHSIGEFVAAHLAGVFTLEDALKLIATRGRLMSNLPGGSMLSVRATIDTIKPFVPDTLSIAAVNSPSLCVIAGPDEAINLFAEMLSEKGIANRLLHTSHAFHSQMMDPVVEPFKKVIESVGLKAPSIPVISTVTGKKMQHSDATDPAYWAKHLRSTVLFADAVKVILEDSTRILLEVGPGNVTATLARQQAGGSSIVAVSTLEKGERVQSEYYSVLKALGQLWLNGIEPDWQVFYQYQQRKKINDLPTYVFDRKQYWINPVLPAQSVNAVQSVNTITTITTPVPAVTTKIESKPEVNKPMRKQQLLTKVKEILENASGIEMNDVTPNMSFIEMGLDSLLLTQVALVLKKEFKLPISFRQLNEEYGNLDLLTSFLDSNLPPEPVAAAPVTIVQEVPVQQQTLPSTNGYAPVNMPAVSSDNSSVLGLIAQQISLLAQQVIMLQNVNVAATPVAVKTTPVQTTAPVVAEKKPVNANGLTAEEEAEIKKPFGAVARIEKKQSSVLTPAQEIFLKDLTISYNQKTKGSKEYTQKHRSYMADPRVVSGFKPLTKEIVYSIVMNKSKGSKMWDIDGNEYIDVLNGFGSNMLGYQPDVIKKALQQQIENGYEIGPQHALAGDVCKLICEFTTFDRSALCNTGSEAVLGAMRIARTVTGRSLVVAFTGSYHGIIDEVIVRGTKKLKTFPAAPGIMPEVVQNMIILDYGTEESLRIIKERAHELAAVLVEPIQSRRPDFQPVEFLKELRKVTTESGSALIFDEVISGFRFHPQGAQGILGIKADLATYGKVVGAGVSIGVIAGIKDFMDALDGGFWQYGDDSFPEVGVTYFAGTFVRHPLALATCKASLEYMKDRGPSLQEGLTKKTKSLVDSLNAICKNKNLPFQVVTFGSLWRFRFNDDISYSDLLFTLMREKGIHILDLFPCFLTEAFTEADLKKVVQVFEESVDAMIAAGFYGAAKENETSSLKYTTNDKPPIPGAKLGKDTDGNPAWFITDPNRPGKFLRVK